MLLFMDEFARDRMTQARKTIISLNDTHYYHCVSRCVRRAFLCGIDQYSGQNYEHRRQWLEDKLLATADIFSIKLCAYAVMSNHYHVVLHVRTDIAKEWSDYDVVSRWHKLYSGNFLSKCFLSNQKLNKNQLLLLQKDIKVWRARLIDISWFMRTINEKIARKANQEDNCTGRFWEGRFKSQALLDDKALLACMTYVDLNPIRAKMAETPEESEYTSIKQRINKTNEKASRVIESFIGNQPEMKGIPFQLKEYLELVDWSGRIIHEGKRGSIKTSLPPIIERLSIKKKAWHTLATEFEKQFKQWVGTSTNVKKAYKDKKYQRIPSTKNQKLLLG